MDVLCGCDTGWVMGDHGENFDLMIVVTLYVVLEVFVVFGGWWWLCWGWMLVDIELLYGLNLWISLGWVVGVLDLLFLFVFVVVDFLSGWCC